MEAINPSILLAHQKIRIAQLEAETERLGKINEKQDQVIRERNATIAALQQRNRTQARRIHGLVISIIVLLVFLIVTLTAVMEAQ